MSTEAHPTLGRIDNAAGLFHGTGGASGYYLALCVTDAAVRACETVDCAICAARVRRRALPELDAAPPISSTEEQSPITARAQYALRCLDDGQHSPAAVARFNQGITAYLDALAAIYGARWAARGQLTIDVDDRDATPEEIEAYVGHDSACTRMLGVIVRAGDGSVYSTCQRGLYDPNPQQDADRAGLGRMARLHRLLSSMYARAERVQQREPRQLKADHHALAAAGSRHLAEAWAA